MVKIPIVIVEDGILGTRMGFEMMIIDIKRRRGGIPTRVVPQIPGYQSIYRV